MNGHYKTLFIVFVLLFTLSIGISFSNYYISLKATQMQIKTQSLPLSVDNIYTEIQKNVIEPSIISSMMSHDTFVIDWLKNNEKNTQKIQNYLESIKNKYGTIVAFLVSKESENYYSHNGIIKQIKKGEAEDAWYYRFKDIAQDHEINLDWNQHISNNMIMFINYKIYDNEYKFLGATGVGIQISYIHDMLTMFHERYKLKVSFVTQDGEILLSEQKEIKNIFEIAPLKEFKNSLLNKQNKIIEYKKDGSTHILTTKYIPEINTYIIVEANIDDFTQGTKNVFYFNLAISMLLTLFIAFIMLFIIKSFQKRLQNLADIDPLTHLKNRRSFSQQFQLAIANAKRKGEKLSLLFMDIDDFKDINDTQGHHSGDLVLQNFAAILRSSIRETDLCARLGGEEFVMVFVGSDAANALLVANTLLKRVAQDETLHSIAKRAVTFSGGIIDVDPNEEIDELIKKADTVMYSAKKEGKNRIHLL